MACSAKPRSLLVPPSRLVAGTSSILFGRRGLRQRRADARTQSSRICGIPYRHGPFGRALRSAAERRGHGNAGKFPATAYSTNHGRHPSTTHFTHAYGVSCSRLRNYVHGVRRKTHWTTPGKNVSTHRRGPSGTPLTTGKFVLGDFKIEGDVHDRDGDTRARILKAWKNRE